MIKTNLFSGADYSVYVLEENSGEEIPLHHHDNWDESWYIIDGKYQITIDGNSKEYTKGEFIFCNRNINHSVKCLEDNSKRMAIFRDGVEIHYED
jgi:quercetin dioxygenase-like cupin family protein